MSVEVLEERVIEAPADIEAGIQKERCATLGGAAIACAGCPFVRFCELKAEVQQGSIVDNEVEESSFDELLGFDQIPLLFPEVDLIQDTSPKAAQQPEKITTPLPYEVKNTTINYIDKLMDDKVEVVFANSITQLGQPSVSDISPKPPVDSPPTEVEQPTSSLKVPAESVKIEVQDASETLELAYEVVEQFDEPSKVALVDKIEPITNHTAKPEIIVNKIKSQAEEQIEFPKNITENILRPKVSVVKKEVVAEPIQKIKKTETIVSTVITDSVDSPIFYNDDFEEIVDEKEQPAEIVLEFQPEFEAELDYTAEAVDVIEILEKAIATKDASEGIELIQVEDVKQPEGASGYIDLAEVDEQIQPESRLYEAMLNSDDAINPETRQVTRAKAKNKWRLLHELAARALVFASY